MCTKVTYKSKKAALKRTRNRRFRIRPRAYKCKECGLWHITKEPADNVLVEIIDPKVKRNGTLRGRRPKPGQTIEQLAKEMRDG